MNRNLTKEEIRFFHENGYLVIENYFSRDDIARARHKADAIMETFDLTQLRIFTTDNQTGVLDRYFLESSYAIRCFFEKEAIDEQGRLTVDKTQAVNKIGHALHELDGDFRALSYRQDLLDIVTSLGWRQPSIVQSQYICKPPRIGARVNPHTDSTFIYTEPLSCLGAWIALEDAHTENGCLYVLPGSHREYPLQQRYLRNAENTGTVFVDTPSDRKEWDLDRLNPVEVKGGDLILLHGELVHASYDNRSRQSRHAYVLHLIDLACRWPGDNWLQRPLGRPFQAMDHVIKNLN